MKNRRREIVLSARIEYDHETRKQRGDRLGPGRSSNDLETEGMESEVRRILLSELPADIEEIYGFEVKTRLIAVRPGSIVVFFGAVVTALGIFSSYSDFFESIALIRKHAKMLLAARLAARYGGGYDVSVDVEYPRVPDPDDLLPGRRFRKMLGGPFGSDEFAGALSWVGQAAGGGTQKRDGFFWFLLASTIVLAVLLGLMVAGAVWRTYFL
jgi:hypothetical protein